MTGTLRTARISTVEDIASSDKSIKIVNFGGESHCCWQLLQTDDSVLIPALLVQTKVLVFSIPNIS